jgi:hypothetical protein
MPVIELSALAPSSVTLKTLVSRPSPAIENPETPFSPKPEATT